MPYLRHPVRAAALYLALSAVAGAASAQTSAGDGGRGFTLVVQALQARCRLVYMARQDIFWSTPSSVGGAAQIVADIARAGRHTSITYRFPPGAAGRVMLDDGVRSSLYDPSHRVLVVGQSSSDDQAAASPTMLALLRHNYRFLWLSRETLNDHACDVVSICPLGQPGPSKRLWIDTSRRAILRTEEYDAQGCRRYVSFYETIRFPSHLSADTLALPQAARGAGILRVTVPSSQAVSAPQAFNEARIAGRVPAWCPGGFALLHCSVIRTQSGTRAVLLHYSDGLKSLVVLEEPCLRTPPASAELDRALARYGQQAWVQEDGRLRTVVRGDLSLPESLGPEMMQALSARTDSVLARGVARDFGGGAAHRGALLRRAGWGYDQIGALCLWEKAHPRLKGRLKSLLGRNAEWHRINNIFGAESASLAGRSRAWIASTLAVAR